MSRHDPKVTLCEMLDFIAEARALLPGRKPNDLGSDMVFTRSAERLIELLGEAANRLPHELRAAAPDVPWGSIIAMRNRLIHGYNTVDYEVVWDTLQNHLESLEQGITDLLQKLES